MQVTINDRARDRAHIQKKSFSFGCKLVYFFPTNGFGADRLHVDRLDFDGLQKGITGDTGQQVSFGEFVLRHV